MGDEATSVLVPCVGAPGHPALGLNDEAAGGHLRLQRLLRVAPSAGAGVARVADDLDVHVRMRERWPKRSSTRSTVGKRSCGTATTAGCRRTPTLLSCARLAGL
jgi:hypothetical protein